MQMSYAVTLCADKLSPAETVIYCYRHYNSQMLLAPVSCCCCPCPPHAGAPSPAGRVPRCYLYWQLLETGPLPQLLSLQTQQNFPISQLAAVLQDKGPCKKGKHYCFRQHTQQVGKQSRQPGQPLEKKKEFQLHCKSLQLPVCAHSGDKPSFSASSSIWPNSM